MSVDPTILIRLKRLNQTFFISTTPSKTIYTIKEEVAKALSGEVSPRKMRIFLSKTSAPLPDSGALSDHASIQNDSTLYIVFRKKGREDEVIDAYDNESDFWESIDITEDD
mmetsp:Transcript_14482/g.17159  ORF Transcript_14482/g.17159 Transcript_14482/m.17159 type:complete len:111 (+) Transcript_14482:120-452(+)|eukprot:CAMPEP_0198275734 /NCGR_PEP_ID=MMETSP1447-20131203/64936_1 /TAXON_ID=420782 /ORGANISM="Chaetoceros dichaeta, Strain CCMP1751" /LENGTH=110 /DNA_ID=CAMNT_0043970629 /DNA_START=90 /DNA_END=422 /DNA_ORIENTATION=+